VALIKISQPAMACNAEDIPGPWYKMTYNTRTVYWGTPVASLALNIRDAANGAPKTPPRKVGDKWVSDFPLKNLVLNAHGGPGAIKLGEWINLSNVGEFRVLKGLVGTIWITSCRVAGREVEDDLDPWDIVSRRADEAWAWVTVSPPARNNDKIAEQFCFKLADVTGAKVIASPQNQIPTLFDVRPNHIDGYEGRAYIYSPGRTKKAAKSL
jgi:hypothetical protein